MALSPATVELISLLGKSAAGAGAAYLTEEEKKRQAILDKQQKDEERRLLWNQNNFNQGIQNQQMAANRRAEVRSAPNSSLGWVQMLQGIGQGSSKANPLDTLRLMAGG